ncbi:hypothetical protein MCOR02_005480 [Pyricularia oryzae]|nr:hypothetical protein MCOR02_005480 [Pyricularia oryzae]
MRNTLVNLSLLLTLASPVFGAAVSKISSDATCGKASGFTCQGSKWGNCCSQYSYCGSSDAYCGTGCQSGYGTCKTTTANPPPSPGPKVSQDATCGNGVTCQGSKWGNCCSSHGWCGSSKDYCGAGCQSLFGTCDGVSTSSTSRSATAGGSSTSSTLTTSRTTTSSTTSSSVTSLTTSSTTTTSGSLTSSTSVTTTTSSSSSSSSTSSSASSSSSSTSTSTSTTSTQGLPTVTVTTISDDATSTSASSSAASSTQTASSTASSSSTATSSYAPSATASTIRQYTQVFNHFPGCSYRGLATGISIPVPNLGPAGDYRAAAVPACQAYCDSSPGCQMFFIAVQQDSSIAPPNDVSATCQVSTAWFNPVLTYCGFVSVGLWESYAYNLVGTGPVTVTASPTVSTGTSTSFVPITTIVDFD